MNKFIGLLAIGISFAFPTSAQKKASDYPLVKISTLEKSKADTVRLKVYVFDIYVCPPCPPGAQCKPCIENNFTALDEKPGDPQKIGFEKKLNVLASHPDSLKTGKRYMITIAFKNKKMNPRGNVTLVAYKPL